MKIIRFAEVVRNAGTPDNHLVLTTPEKDSILKKAIASDRVMTIHQTAVGRKADYGTIGFLPGVLGQTLIFPKTLKSYKGRGVVGIDFGLLKSNPTTRSTSCNHVRKRPEPIKIPKEDLQKKIDRVLPLRSEGPKGSTTPGRITVFRKQVRKALTALSERKYRTVQTILENLVKP